MSQHTNPGQTSNGQPSAGQPGSGGNPASGSTNTDASTQANASHHTDASTAAANDPSGRWQRIAAVGAAMIPPRPEHGSFVDSLREGLSYGRQNRQVADSLSYEILLLSARNILRRMQDTDNDGTITPHEMRILKDLRALTREYEEMMEEWYARALLFGERGSSAEAKVTLGDVRAASPPEALRELLPPLKSAGRRATRQSAPRAPSRATRDAATAGGGAGDDGEPLTGAELEKLAALVAAGNEVSAGVSAAAGDAATGSTRSSGNGTSTGVRRKRLRKRS